MTENDVIDSLTFKDNAFTLNGKTKDFKSLDDIKNKLAKNYKTVDILNTKIEKEALIFTVRAIL
jgi:predicted nucleic acid-binding OB-fold protein